MSQLFISHSSENNFEAIALKQWLADNGWDDVFLDLDPERGIVAGERWERALHEAASRCDAVLFLISQAWLDSGWCRKEFQLACGLNKQIIALLVEDIPVVNLPEEFTAHWQLVSLVGGELTLVPAKHPQTNEERHISFSKAGLTRLHTGLTKAGFYPTFFEWPPEGDKNRSPYRGLMSLDIEDAGIFFGREAPTIELLSELRGLRQKTKPQLLAILGASGAGKSSFLRAGILPRLMRDNRHFLPLPIVRPANTVISGKEGIIESLLGLFKAHNVKQTRGQLKQWLSDNTNALVDALAELVQDAKVPVSPGEQQEIPWLVLPIDQGEELFARDGADEATVFLSLLSNLLQTANLPLLVVFTIRADRYDELQTTSELSGIQQHTFSLTPMPQGAYRDVIVKPAERFSQGDRRLIIEPVLVDTLLNDLHAGGSKDALPILAFTLERLYHEYGDDGDLTLSEYQQLGGITGAINAAIDNVYAQAQQHPDLPSTKEARDKLIRRGLIPWLTGIDPDTKSPRRRVALLSMVPAESQTMIELLIRQRLLVTDTNADGEITVEPAHEAIFRQWVALKEWLNDDVELHIALEGLQRASMDWDANDRDEYWLSHSAGRLESVEQLNQRDDFASFLTSIDKDYLNRCRVQENERKDKALAQQMKIVRRTLAGLVASSLLAVLAIGAGWFATQKMDEATSERNNALSRQSLFLADLARQEMAMQNYETALLLSLNSIPGLYGGEIPEVEPARERFRKASLSVTKNTRLVHESSALFAAFSPDGQTMVSVYEDGAAILWSTDNHEQLQIYGHRGPLLHASISSDGQLLVTASKDGTSTLWSTLSGEQLQVFTHDNSVLHVNFSPDGKSVVTASKDGTAVQWSIATGKRLHTFFHGEHVEYTTFSPDGKSLMTVNGYTAIIWDVDSGEQQHKLGETNRPVNHAEFSPDGEKVIVVSRRGSASLWWADSGKRKHVLAESRNGFLYATFSPNSRIAVTSNKEGVAELWSVDNGDLLNTLPHEFNPVYGNYVEHLEFSPDGQFIITVNNYRAVLWETKSGERLRVFESDAGIFYASFDAYGKMIVTVNADSKVDLWPILPAFSVEDAIKRLPKNRTCLSPEERTQYFMPILNDEQWKARGCPQYTSKSK